MSKIKFMYNYHIDNSIPQKDSKWIFVFGSNVAGIHGAGAAKEALKSFGARSGVGFGLERKSYGIPTKDDQIRTLSLMQIHANITMARRQITHRIENTDECYFFTRIGCGLAGYADRDIAPMFAGMAAHLATGPERLTTRISFAEEWRPFLEPELHNDAVLEEVLFKEPTHDVDITVLKNMIQTGT